MATLKKLLKFPQTLKNVEKCLDAKVCKIKRFPQNFEKCLDAGHEQPGLENNFIWENFIIGG